MNRNKILIGVLVLSLVMGLFAGFSPSVEAADETVAVWFSGVRNGGSTAIAEADSEVFLNFEYTGGASSYTVEINLEDPDGKMSQLGIYKNTAKECISIGKLSEGTYHAYVVVSAGDEQESGSGTIDMLVGIPVIREQPKDTTTNPYQNVTFRTLSNTPGATYQWYKSRSLKEEGEPISGSISNDLTITAENVSPEIAGTYYYCKVTANGITVNTNYAKLTINGYGPVVTPTAAPKPTTTPTVTSTVSPTPEEKSPIPTKEPMPTTEGSKITKSITATGKYQKSNQSVKLTYPTISGAIYTIYRGKKGDGELKPIATTTNNTYIDTNQTKTQGVVWRYRIYARTSTYSYMSNILSITVNMKPKIKSFQVKKSGRYARLSWTADAGTKVHVYVTSGKKFYKLGTLSAKKKACKVLVPKQYKKAKLKIRIYQKVGKKKYYSSYSKVKTIKF